MATGLERRELVREQELPAPVQQGQAAPFAPKRVPGPGLAGPGRVVPRQVPLGLRDQRFDLDQSASAVGWRQRLEHGRLPLILQE